MTAEPALRSAWSTRHEWFFSPLELLSQPPAYEATCARCGECRRGRYERFGVADCPSRISTAAR